VLCKTAEQIKVLFAVETFENPRHIVSCRGSYLLRAMGLSAAFAKFSKCVQLYNGTLKFCVMNFHQKYISYVQDDAAYDAEPYPDDDDDDDSLLVGSCARTAVYAPKRARYFCANFLYS